MIAAKENGMSFFLREGNAELGPAIAGEQALRAELTATERAYGVADRGEGRAYLAEREYSNPYAAAVLDRLAAMSSSEKALVGEARAAASDNKMIMAGEPFEYRLNNDQLRTAVNTESKVIEAGR